MKKLMSVIIAFCCFSNIAFADCNYSTGVTPLSNGEYSYIKECHIKNGENVRDLRIANEQVSKLMEATSLMDLALSKANKRADLWQQTSNSLEKRVETMEDIYKTNKWLYFGLGILATGAAIYAAGQLRK